MKALSARVAFKVVSAADSSTRILLAHAQLRFVLKGFVLNSIVMVC